MMKYFFILASLTILVTLVILYYMGKQDNMSEEQKLAAYQVAADVVRIHALDHWATLIHEYRSKTGEFPLSDLAYQEGLHVYTFIATEEQMESIAEQQAYLPRNTAIVRMDDFVKILEEGLGYTIEEKYDPQKVGSGAPNFLLYMINLNSFYLAAHFLNPYSFTGTVDDAYQKVEITDLIDTHYQITYADLQKNSEYQKMLAEVITSKWFIDLYNENRNATKESSYTQGERFGMKFKRLTETFQPTTSTPSSTSDPMQQRLETFLRENLSAELKFDIALLEKRTKGSFYEVSVSSGQGEAATSYFFIVPSSDSAQVMPVSDKSDVEQMFNLIQ